MAAVDASGKFKINNIFEINNESDNSPFKIKNGTKEVVTVSSNGTLIVSNDTSSQKVIQVKNNGTETAWVKADGTSSFGGTGVCTPDYTMGSNLKTANAGTVRLSQNGWVHWGSAGQNTLVKNGYWIKCNGVKLATYHSAYSVTKDFLFPVAKNDLIEWSNGTSEHDFITFYPCRTN